MTGRGILYSRLIPHSERLVPLPAEFVEPPMSVRILLCVPCNTSASSSKNPKGNTDNSNNIVFITVRTKVVVTIKLYPWSSCEPNSSAHFQWWKRETSKLQGPAFSEGVELQTPNWLDLFRGFRKLGEPLVGIPIIRPIVHWGLCCGPSI